MGPILIHLPVLHKSDHCRADICVGIWGKTYFFFIMQLAGIYLRYKAVHEWIDVRHPWSRLLNPERTYSTHEE
jgi:hypothetical protein